MTPDGIADAVAGAFADAVSRAAHRSVPFRCAVPGGSVATVVFPRIARQRLTWPSVEIFLADERLVAPDHPDSNARAVTEHWLEQVEGPLPRLHPMPTRADDVDAAARHASEALCLAAGTPPRLDLVLLGVGPDGHVASLFPHRLDWRTSDAWIVPVRDAPKPPPTRLSLGLATLSVAREIWFVAFGAEKARVLQEARERPDSALPVAVVARSGPVIRWYLDDAASGS